MEDDDLSYEAHTGLGLHRQFGNDHSLADLVPLELLQSQGGALTSSNSRNDNPLVVDGPNLDGNEVAARIWAYHQAVTKRQASAQHSAAHHSTNARHIKGIVHMERRGGRGRFFFHRLLRWGDVEEEPEGVDPFARHAADQENRGDAGIVGHALSREEHVGIAADDDWDLGNSRGLEQLSDVGQSLFEDVRGAHIELCHLQPQPPHHWSF
mmetsp:Transcript_39037/g.103185  ORF Transcript_39037/g.103185 Transcript_39037/m.103185 type:complete len:210 (+) Transcript_39037:478-1107(+)